MKYMLIGPTWEPTKMLFDDLGYCNNVIRRDGFFCNTIMAKIFSHHMNGRLKRLGGKRLWPKMMELSNAYNNQHITYIYIGTDILDEVIKCNIVPYLKCKNHDSKHVGYLMDIHGARRLDIDKLKRMLDIIYIFDSIEASRMGIKYYPIPFSRGQYSDICYVGQNKGRLEELVKIYDRLTPYGIKCFFYICNVSDKEQIHRDGIVYGPLLDPAKSLRCIQNTNCVLELKVDGVSSYSDRVQKAIAYNKKILTNNIYLKNNRFYNKEMMCIYTNVEEIDPNFIKDSINFISYGYTDEYSPINFLKQINTDLNVDIEF